MTPSSARAGDQRVPGPRERFPGATMLAFWRDPPNFLLSLAQTYGPVARFRWGRVDEYLLNDPELTRRVLVADQRTFMKGQALQEAKRILGEGLLTSEEELHARQRRLIQPLFHARRVEAYGETMVACAERAGSRWRDGEVVDAHAEMARLTLAVVGLTLFDADVEGEAEEIGAALTDALESIKSLMVPWSRLLDALPFPVMRRLERSRARLDRTIYRLVDERRRDGRARDDLLSLLVEARDEDGRPMPDEQLRDEAMTLFLAGHETTAAALTWTWLLLSEHPHVEARLHAELDAVLGGRPPTVADLRQLPYTEMVVSEAIRLYPPAWLIGRRALADFPVDGFVLPRGSIVILSPYVSHRDPRWFPEPGRFDPERWTEEARRSRPRWAYFPFGGGARTCVGEAFAWTEAKLLLATLARRWRLRPMPGHHVALHPRVTLRPKGGLPLRLEARAPGPPRAARPGARAASTKRRGSP